VENGGGSAIATVDLEARVLRPELQVSHATPRGGHGLALVDILLLKAPAY
jgi:hypothetical protein